MALFAVIILAPLPGQKAQVRELVAAFPSGDLILDPLHSFKTQELQIATAIYEGLVSYHPSTLRPIPAAAYRWEVSKGGLIYHFFLRRRAKFSNGDRVLAKDFRNSWLRILDPRDEGEYSFLFDVIKGAFDYRSGKVSDPETVGIRVLEDDILEVELARPAGHFLSMLCHMSFVPLHPNYLDSVSWEQDPPIIGNGPFVLVRRSSGEIMLHRNESYWDRWNVELDAIHIRFMDDPSRIAQGLNDLSIHWADSADTRQLENANMIQFHPMFATSYLYFRADAAPWDDALIRRALTLLLPWKSIREGSSAFATDRLVPALSFYPDVEGVTEPNQEKAFELLDRAGYPDGKKLPEISILVPRGSAGAVAAEEIAQIWKDKLQTEVRIEAVDYERYTAEVQEGGFTIGASTWIGDFADPLTFLQMWTSGSKLNDARYENPRYDDLIDRALADAEMTRYEKLAEAERLLLTDEAVVIPLAHPPALNIIDLDRIGGWFPNVLDVHPFKYMKFKAPQIPQWIAAISSLSLLQPLN